MVYPRNQKKKSFNNSKLTKNMKPQIYKIFIIVLGVGLWTLTSCQRDPNDPGTEFAPQMYLSKSYEPYTQTEANSLNPLGINMRSPAQNTIPRRRFNPEFELEDSLGKVTRVVDVMYYNISRDDAGREIASKTLKNPLPITEKTLAEGKALYTSYCSACHGAAGEGDGKVSQKYKGVANLKGSAYANLTAGHIFHVITNGKGLMWPHGSQLNADERWKVVHFVHQLMGKIPADLSAPVDDKQDGKVPTDSTMKGENTKQALKQITPKKTNNKG